MISIIVPAHNEEAVISGCIEALLNVDYPRDRLTIMPVNDRSTDGTRQIIDSYADRNPGRLQLFHRQDGPPGKAAALATPVSELGALRNAMLMACRNAPPKICHMRVVPKRRLSPWTNRTKLADKRRYSRKGTISARISTV